MDFKQAIDKLKTLEGGADLASAIEAHAAKLEEKNFTTIGESRSKGAKAQAFGDALTAIAKSLGIEGDLESSLTAVEAKARELASGATTLQSRLTEVETRASTAEGKLKTFERQGRIQDLATKAGANPKAFERLLGDRLDEIKLDGEAVKLGDKTLKEFVEDDAELKGFLPALFPVAAQAESSPQRLPSGAPTTVPTEKPDLAAAYIGRAYGGFKSFLPKT